MLVRLHIINLFRWRYLLRAALALDVLRHQQVLAIVDDVGEVGDPVAKDYHTGLLGELQVYLDMAMAVDEVVYVGVILDISLGVEHQMLAVFTHICRLLSARALETAVLRPVQSEPYTPAGMKCRECQLAELVMEDALDELEALAWVAQAVAMGQEEQLAVDLRRLRLLMQYHAALLLQVLIGPDVMVAGEVMHLDTHVGQFGYLAEKAREALRHHILVFVPEVEHVAQQVDGCCLLLDGVEESHEPALLHPSVWDCQRP